MLRNKATLAAAVAALFALGAGQAFAEEGQTTEAKKIQCEGVNDCKGHGSCKSAQNDCSGKNGCAGKGFMMMTQAECDAAKAKMKAKEKDAG